MLECVAGRIECNKQRLSGGMNSEIFPYDQWISDAMRSVLKRALKKLADGDLMGEHHLYVNFRTTGDDVGIPGFLKAQYPEEMTIVLQHQFEDLYIDEDGFEVTLSFSGHKHRLNVPFEGVTSFADPSANFVVQIGSEALKSIGSNGGFDAGNALQISEEDKTQSDLADPRISELSSNNIDEIAANKPKGKFGGVSGKAKVINMEAFRTK